jgi:hypothetical protein
MTVTVHHGKHPEQARGLVDGSIEKLLASVGGGELEIANLKKNWDGPKMDFSMVAKLGFISIPLSGSALVEITTLTIDLILPPMVRNFIGEDEIRSGLEDKFREIFAA